MTIHAKQLNGDHVGHRITIRRDISGGTLITGVLRHVHHHPDTVYVRFTGLRPQQSIVTSAIGIAPADSFPLDPDDPISLEHD